MENACEASLTRSYPNVSPIAADTESMCTQADHAAIKADPQRWVKLVHIGDNVFEADETGPAERIEQRNCSCGSTLAISIKL